MANSIISHGHARRHRKIPSEYQAWRDMRARCCRETHKVFKHYGGRGIKICDRWIEYENFLADMGLKPSPKHTLDRIDNDGNYEPSNCRWALQIDQLYNRRVTKRYEFRGRLMTTREIAAEVGLTVEQIACRARFNVPFDAPYKPRK